MFKDEFNEFDWIGKGPFKLLYYRMERVLQNKVQTIVSALYSFPFALGHPQKR